jgi:hypothetical protein
VSQGAYALAVDEDKSWGLVVEFNDQLLDAEELFASLARPVTSFA